ncbi:hypothetical protein CAAN1_04S04148 [[Candida] anglica]|uniref:FYVE-type domain-containing protein n=1 Tax=[Candida] anglica TaxID=148631 RepID=A0ABP0EBI2_9ASCO
MSGQEKTSRRRVFGTSNAVKVPPTETTIDESVSKADSVGDQSIQCPICQEGMITLQQLDQHITDIHDSNNDSRDSTSHSPPHSNHGSHMMTSTSPLPTISLPTINNEFLNGSVGKWIKSNFDTNTTGIPSDSPSRTSNNSPSTTPQRRKTIKLDVLDNNKGFSLRDDNGTFSNSKHPNVFNEAEMAVYSESSSPLRAGGRANTRISRAHWQQPSSVNNDTCTDSTCRKHLNVKNGKVNCRKCGKLYCNEHTYYKVRLMNTSTIPDYQPSKSGTWSRVCQNCYLKKPDLVDEERSAFSVDLTTKFKRIRSETNDERELIRNRVQKRFIKLVDLLADYYLSTKPNETFNLWNTLSSISKPSKWTKEYILNEERKIVGYDNWLNDHDVKQCPICFSPFNILTRRHHCRFCGKIVCDGTLNGKQIVCSMDVPLSILLEKLCNLNYSPSVRNNIDELLNVSHTNEKFRIRSCVECKDILLYDWKRKGGEQQQPHQKDRQDNESIMKDKIFQLHSQQLNVKERITQLYPRYEQLIKTYDQKNVDEINKLRVKLMSFLRDFESLTGIFKKSFFEGGKDIVKPRTTFSPDYQQLIKNIYQGAVLFLQDTLINVKTLSNTLKEAERSSVAEQHQLLSETENNVIAGSIDSHSPVSASPTPMSPKSSTPVQPNLTKRQIRELREELMVMNEQKFIVKNLIQTATKQRKFDELQLLSENKSELENTIHILESKLGDFAFS